MNITRALEKLKKLLPLEKRQKNLSPEHRQIHQGILNVLSIEGKVLDNIEQSVLNILAKNDLVVLDKGTNVIGAYPFSLRKTAHHIFNDNIDLYAMCAFDAVAIAPVFNIKTNIVSSCHLTKEKIEISQNGYKVIDVTPSDKIFIGIRWQSAGSCAANNLCMEMVFLKNKDIALQWKNDDEDYSVFSLVDAIEFSIKYFKPLLES
jgi:Alkylmercury lyase